MKVMISTASVIPVDQVRVTALLTASVGLGSGENYKIEMKIK